MGILFLGLLVLLRLQNILWLELYRCYRGVCLAKKFGFRTHIMMDSKVRVDILSGNCHCPTRVLCLPKKIVKSLDDFEEFQLHHVRRKEANQPVDFLASWGVGNIEQLLFPTAFLLF